MDIKKRWVKESELKPFELKAIPKMKTMEPVKKWGKPKGKDKKNGK